MKKKKKQKTTNKKELVVDTTIIEHLACLEVNEKILQPPFHLVSNIQWNDKGVSFDGDIEVYSSQKIDKANFIDKVPVQVKGTTTPKTVYSSGEIRHSVKKDDLEVYYKHGRGVLYFVVTIIPITYIRQAYYKILTPLDLKGILLELEKKGNESITLDFQALKKGSLENICIGMIDAVEKQPKRYIEANEKMNFANYQVEFMNVDNDCFNIFQDTAYIYGFNSDSIRIPLKAARVVELNKRYVESVSLDTEQNSIEYYTTETQKEYTVVIENTLIINHTKEDKSVNFSFEKLKTLGSYLKCLKLIKYYTIHNKFPFRNFSFEGSIQKGNDFLDIEGAMTQCTELIEVCKQIGINENYEFNEQEDLNLLFGTIVGLFKNKQYDLINIDDPINIDEYALHVIPLSDYVKVKLLYTEGGFFSFYSEKALSIVRRLLPKIVGEKQFKKDDELPDNWEDYFFKMSIYTTQKIDDMVRDANFNFDIIKLSFSEQYHDIRTDDELNIPVEYMRYYIKSKSDSSLELALELNYRRLATFPQDTTAKINIYLIKLLRRDELTGEEINVIWNMKEEASKNEDNLIRFACEVLMKNKTSAKRVFDLLSEEERELMISFPIYDYYKELK